MCSRGSTNAEFPGTAEAIAEVKRNSGKQIPVDVLRQMPSGWMREKIVPDPGSTPRTVA